jgi:hypothetical protein
MGIDRFTKVVLTVIAVALAVLAGVETVRLFQANEVVAKAGGTAPVQRVTVCNEKGEFCASVDETGRLFVK